MLLKKIFSIILSFLDIVIPDMDQSALMTELANVINMVLPVFGNCIAILRMFLGDQALKIISVFLGAIVALNTVYMMYSIVMWVVSKIPFLGIK